MASAAREVWTCTLVQQRASGLVPPTLPLVQAIEVVASLTRLPVVAVVEDAATIIGLINTLSLRTAHNPRTLNVSICAAGDITAVEECNQTDEISAPATGRVAD